MNPFYRNNTILVILLLLLTDSVQSQTIVPYYTANKNPFVILYGLPSTEPARCLAENKSIINLSIDYVNNSRWMKSADEELLIDGETQTATLRLRRGLRNKTEIGVDVPVVTHNAGVADNFIADWHKLLHLPNNQRRLPYDKANQLKYSYIDSGDTVVDIQRSTAGIGDVKLLVAKQITMPFTMSLRGGIELPSGKSDKLLGSGSVDSFVYISAQASPVATFQGLTFYGSAGLFHPGQGEILEQKLKFLVGFGSLGLQLRITEKFSFKLQTDMHSSLFDSSIDALGDASAQWVMGGTLKLFETYWLDVAIIENIFTDAVPDVAWHLAITRYF